jgi:hypothetical protein
VFNSWLVAIIAEQDLILPETRQQRKERIRARGRRTQVAYGERKGKTPNRKRTTTRLWSTRAKQDEMLRGGRGFTSKQLNRRTPLMLDGIKLLIDRMEHHPEEFFGDLAYRWADIMQDIAKHGPEYLEEDDLMLLNKKVKEVRRKELNAKILDEIASQQRLQYCAGTSFLNQVVIDRTTPYRTGSSYS